MNILHPLEPTATGSLKLARTPEEDAKSRAALLTGISKGERRTLPRYGRPTHLFKPAFGDRLQAAELQAALNQGAVEDGDIYFTVKTADDSSDHHPHLEVYWKSRISQTEGGFSVQR